MPRAPKSSSPFTTHQPLEHLNRIPLSLPIGSHHIDLLYWGVLGARFWRNYLHTHSFFEICYTFAGAGAFTINNTTHAIRPGTLFIARPSEPHEIISDKKRPLGICYWAYTMIKSKAPGADVAAVDDLFTAFATSQRILANPCPNIDATLRLLIEESTTPRAGYTQAVAALTTKLLLDTARHAVDSVAPEPIEPRSRTSTEASVQSVIRYLRDNLSRPLETRDLAAQVHLSERHLRRLFKTVTKTSIHDYLVDLRLRTATQLLLDPNRSIKQIAAEVGYPDVRYFTTLFHKQIGTTPAKFRATGGTQFLTKTPGT
jgi:AraC family L-rhamnose operon transcriptional activator RhaR